MLASQTRCKAFVCIEIASLLDIDDRIKNSDNIYAKIINLLSPPLFFVPRFIEILGGIAD